MTGRPALVVSELGDRISILSLNEEENGYSKCLMCSSTNRSESTALTTTACPLMVLSPSLRLTAASLPDFSSLSAAGAGDLPLSLPFLSDFSCKRRTKDPSDKLQRAT